jgi:hypothetical protein
LVSVEQARKDQVKAVFDAVNKALESLGHPTIPEEQGVDAVLYIVIRRETHGGLLYGYSSKAKVMRAVLSFLCECGMISEEFARAAYFAWMEADEGA